MPTPCQSPPLSGLNSRADLAALSPEGFLCRCPGPHSQRGHPWLIRCSHRPQSGWSKGPMFSLAPGPGDSAVGPSATEERASEAPGSKPYEDTTAQGSAGWTDGKARGRGI